VNRLDATLEDLRSLDALASRDTALSRLDPRAKIVATLLFVVTVVSFDRYRVAALVPLAIYPVALATLGDVPSRLLLRTLWLASPFAVLLGIANPWFDRAPMLSLHGVELSAGWVSFTAILLRFALTAGAAVALIAGTGMAALCAGLARLGVPRIFTVQLLFLYRYAFVLTGEAGRMATARRLRAGEHSRLPLSAYAALVGHLLLRALGRAERVHAAMLSRGFDGELRITHRWCWRRADTVFVLGWGTFFALARAFDLPRAIGAALGGVLA